MRERSRVAGFSAFSAYLLGTLVLQRFTGNGFSVFRIIFLALLFANIRGNWLAARWTKDAFVPTRLNQTLGDKLADQMPAILWPKVRSIFYVIAVAEIALLVSFLIGQAPLRRTESPTVRRTTINLERGPVRLR